MRRKAWERKISVLVAVCMVVAGLWIPGNVSIVRAEEGIENINVGDSSSGDASGGDTSKDDETGGAKASELLWGCDFDSFTEGTYTLNENVFKRFVQGKYSHDIVADSSNVTDKELKITVSENPTGTGAFSHTSIDFEPTAKVAFEFDMYRGSEDSISFAVYGTDGTSKKPVAEMFFRGSDGQLAYNKEYAGEEVPGWGYTTKTYASDVWMKVCLIVEQSEEEGKDKFSVYVDGVNAYTYSGTFKNSGLPSYIFLSTSGSGIKNGSSFDNLAVYEYVPAEAAAFAEAEYSVEAGSTVQLSASVTPVNAACIKEVIYSSSDTTKATVDADGLVTGVAEGEALITVTVINVDGTAVSGTTTVKVAEATKGLLWECDFDDFTEGAYTLNENVFKRFVKGKYSHDIVADSSNAADKELKITLSENPTGTGAFSHTSIDFEPTAKVAFEFDMYRGSEDSISFAVYGTDGTSKKPVAEMFFRGSDGQLAYNKEYAGEEVPGWGYTTKTYASDVWMKVCLIVEQSEEEGKDKFSVYVDGVRAYTYSGTFKNSGLPSYVFLSTSGSGIKSGSSFDNMAVRECVPATEVSFGAAEYTVEVGEKVQLSATVAPAACLPRGDSAVFS